MSKVTAQLKGITRAMRLSQGVFSGQDQGRHGEVIAGTQGTGTGLALRTAGLLSTGLLRL